MLDSMWFRLKAVELRRSGFKFATRCYLRIADKKADKVRLEVKAIHLISRAICHRLQFYISNTVGSRTSIGSSFISYEHQMGWPPSTIYVDGRCLHFTFLSTVLVEQQIKFVLIKATSFSVTFSLSSRILTQKSTPAWLSRIFIDRNFPSIHFKDSLADAGLINCL